MNILIVDDDATNRLVLKGLLERDNHHVIQAENGQEAIEYFREYSPDMVLMDIMMPVMDGYEATRIIKSECGDAFVPVIFLTALSGDEAIVSCIEHGGDDFLRKPYNRSILQAKISALDRIRQLYETVQEQNQELHAFQAHTIREHEVAEKIFKNVVAQSETGSLPMVNSVRRSAEAFNGDIVMAARNASGGISVLVGDFTGHGLTAAIGAIPVAEVFYKMTSKGFPVEDVIPEINTKLRQLLPTGRFLAACLMHIDTACRNLTIWNGGLPDMLITDASGIVNRVTSTKVPLGVLDSIYVDNKPEHVRIQAGYKLHVYTDGVTEAVNDNDEMYGQERLEELIAKIATTEDLSYQHLLADIEAFRGGKAQQDDITYLEFDCDPEQMLQVAASQNKEFHRPASSWRVKLEFEYDALKHADPVPALLQMVSEVQGLESHRSSLFTILSELYNNALEHGILGMDSAMKADANGFARYYQQREEKLRKLTEGGLSVELTNRPAEDGGCLEISIADSGKGFDSNRQHNGEECGSRLRHSGRGLDLVRAMCASLEFSEKGNRVRAVYDWKYQD